MPSREPEIAPPLGEGRRAPSCELRLTRKNFGESHRELLPLTASSSVDHLLTVVISTKDDKQATTCSRHPNGAGFFVGYGRQPEKCVWQFLILIEQLLGI
jgi:hypothetical protein